MPKVTPQTPDQINTGGSDRPAVTGGSYGAAANLTAVLIRMKMGAADHHHRVDNWPRDVGSLAGADQTLIESA